MSEPTLIEPYLAAARAHRLVLPHCADCGAYHWYPLPLCPGCQSDGWQWREVSGRARLVSWTSVEHPFSEQLRPLVPYLVALVEPVEAPGVHLVTTVVGADRLHVGMALEVDFAVPVAADTEMPVFRVAGGR